MMTNREKQPCELRLLVPLRQQQLTGEFDEERCGRPDAGA